VVGPLLFIVVFLIEGATRPGHGVWRNYVSDLALSDQGWEQQEQAATPRRATPESAG